ncbi:MAG TPA: hypothetical protein VIY48_03630 [Candidatus Paceibacterota bacterium]
MSYELKTVSKVIGGMEFQTTQFPAVKALEVMSSLQKLQSADMSKAMSALKPGEAKALFLEVLQCTTTIIETPQGKKLITFDKAESLDRVFSGKLKTMFDVLAHAIEVNYGDFNEGSTDPAPLAPTLDQ